MEKTFDPYDMGEKCKLHPKADEKNFIAFKGNTPQLRCGAQKSKGGVCRSIAGMGTDHKGWGRCKFCGGCTTGPKTAAGKRRSAQNSRKHGLYAKHLSEEEKAIYEEIRAKKSKSLEEEIAFLKTRLTSYLKFVWTQERAAGRKGLIRRHRKGDRVTEYAMGTIEDPHVHKTLEQIRRLVATEHAIDAVTEESLLDQINAELRAANKNTADQSWQGRPGSRKSMDMAASENE